MDACQCTVVHSLGEKYWHCRRTVKICGIQKAKTSIGREVLINLQGRMQLIVAFA